MRIIFILILLMTLFNLIFITYNITTIPEIRYYPKLEYKYINITEECPVIDCYSEVIQKKENYKNFSKEFNKR